jgi:hypothetical protein
MFGRLFPSSMTLFAPDTKSCTNPQLNNLQFKHATSKSHTWPQKVLAPWPPSIVKWWYKTQVMSGATWYFLNRVSSGSQNIISQISIIFFFFFVKATTEINIKVLWNFLFSFLFLMCSIKYHNQNPFCLIQLCVPCSCISNEGFVILIRADS